MGEINLCFPSRASRHVVASPRAERHYSIYYQCFRNSWQHDMSTTLNGHVVAAFPARQGDSTT